MVRLAAALAGLALALSATASAFGKTDQPVRMTDGVRLTTTYYVPDGAPPAGGWPAAHAPAPDEAHLALTPLTLESL
jgi:predicted acyl esterase